MNHALRTLWPYYNKAIGKMVMDMARPMIEEQLKPVRPAALQAACTEVLCTGCLASVRGTVAWVAAQGSAEAAGSRFN